MHQHIGYGVFQLLDLLPGEDFARFDGTHCRVSSTTAGHGDSIAVRLDVGTLNERTAWLHRTARVHALSQEQAARIQNRIRNRKRKEN